MNLTKPQTRFFANLLTNLSAGWIGVIIISPNFTNLQEKGDLSLLIFDVIFAIIFSDMAIRMEKRIK
jgi:hypothetical protein